MNGGLLLSVRSWRVVAIGRAVMALFLIASFLLGPHGAPDQNHPLDLLLAANLAWAALLLAASRSRLIVYRLSRVAVLPPTIDLAVFTTLLYLTSGADSPYFSPFVFLILAATLQWGSRGAVVMGLVTLAVFAPAGWQVAFGDDSSEAAAQSFVLRLGYTVVISVMLVAFGRHVERVVEELSRLSDPLAGEGADAGPPVRECLRHALWVFGAERGMLLLEEADEPYGALTVFTHGRFEARRLAPGAEDWVAPAAADSVFLFDARNGATLVRQDRRTVAGPAKPLAQALLAEASFGRVLVIPAATRGLTGWVFVFDHDEPANEDLAIGAMVSAQVSVALERWESQRARRAASAAEDRLRLARDLHDGVLQFLAGARLHLDSLAQSKTLPHDAQTRIATLRGALVDEQTELRGFISTLRPARDDEDEVRRPLSPELTQLAERLSRYWTVEVAATVTPVGLQVSQRLSYDLGRIVRESVANAVRHGGARQVVVEATAAGDRLTVQIDDNGGGFAFEGEFTAEQLVQSGGAPRSLHERVRALDGRLSLASSPKGARVMIDVPLETP